jgi:hypothetical protein
MDWRWYVWCRQGFEDDWEREGIQNVISWWSLIWYTHQERCEVSLDALFIASRMLRLLRYALSMRVGARQ